MLTKKVVALFLALILLTGVALPGTAAEVKSRTPLLEPQTVQFARTEDQFLNLLLLGLDISSGNISASGNKRNIMDSHTDVLMLVSINLTKGRIDLISLPRDTLVYVPGVHGVYKLNAAFNTATNVREGLRHTTETVSWFLGGIRVDAYCALDLNALIELGDIMGGVDFDLEMSYTGTIAGRKYAAGHQHLDGIGIADYVRARKNASTNANDLGRTDRGRRMVIAIFDRIRSDYNMLNELWAATQKSSMQFYTNLDGISTIMDLWDFFQAIDSAEIGSYVFDGEYVSLALGYWNMHLIDQDERIRILKEVFGLKAEKIPYITAAHCKWLLGNGTTTGGFRAVQKIRQAYLILDYARLRSKPSKELKNAIQELEKAYKAAVIAFDDSADRKQNSDDELYNKALPKLIKTATTVAQLCDYPDEVRWERLEHWFEDPLVNDYYEINWN